jgi:hypothetical protein
MPRVQRGGDSPTQVHRGLNPAELGHLPLHRVQPVLARSTTGPHHRPVLLRTFSHRGTMELPTSIDQQAEDPAIAHLLFVRSRQGPVITGHPRDQLISTSISLPTCRKYPLE